MKLKRLIKNQYDREEDFDFMNDGAVELTDPTGFIPRSAEIKRMLAQGELNILMEARQNEILKGKPIDELPPISVLNLKDLDRIDISENLKRRYAKYNQLQSEIQASLLRSAPATPTHLEQATVADSKEKAGKSE